MKLIARGRRQTDGSIHAHPHSDGSPMSEFAIAPGASAVVRSSLSPQNRTLLSRLGGGPLDVMLSGPRRQPTASSRWCPLAQLGSAPGYIFLMATPRWRR